MKALKRGSVYTEEFDDRIDKIRHWYLDDKLILSEFDNEVKTRLETAFTMLCSFNSNEEVVKILIERFKYSRRQAYYDIRNAIDVFGDVVKTKKEASKYILYEMAMRNYKKAEVEGDIDQMNKSLSNLIKITGVDRDDFDLPDPAKIFPPTMILQLSPDFLNSAFAKVVDESVKKKISDVIRKLNQVIEESRMTEYLDTFNVIDVEHEEVKDDD